MLQVTQEHEEDELTNKKDEMNLHLLLPRMKYSSY